MTVAEPPGIALDRPAHLSGRSTHGLDPSVRRSRPQRVNRWLAQNGVCSRREAEALISQGLVSIDGLRVDDIGRKIEPGQTLVLSDRVQAQLEGALTVMIHKPIGIASAQPPAVRLLTREALFGQSPVIPGFSNNLAPVGRLDMDSRGLLILSEDGVVAKAVIGPASEMEKEYLVWVDGWITDQKLALLRHGLDWTNARCDPPGSSWLAVSS
jgi:23S rRNA pseudouridine2604 synthase